MKKLHQSMFTLHHKQSSLIERLTAAFHSISTVGPLALSSPGTCKIQVLPLVFYALAFGVITALKIHYDPHKEKKEYTIGTSIKKVLSKETVIMADFFFLVLNYYTEGTNLLHKPYP
jgi:hypothetical protein